MITFTTNYRAGMKKETNATQIKTGFVYVVSFEDGLLKIGQSKKPEQRVHQIRDIYGRSKVDKYFISFEHSGYGDTERLALSQFSEHKTQGEWRECAFDDVISFLQENNITGIIKQGNTLRCRQYPEVSIKGPITNQSELADAIGVTQDALSRGKTIKGYLSVERYTQLSKITGIDRDLWIAGPRKRLAKKLKEFFRSEKMRA